MSTAFEAVGSQIPSPHDMFDVAPEEITKSAWPAVVLKARAANEFPQTLQMVFLRRPDIIASSDVRACTYHTSDKETIRHAPGSAARLRESQSFVSAKAGVRPHRKKDLHAETRRELQETADDLFAVIQSGAVKIAINQRFPLAQARQAHEALHSRATTGATILIP